MSLVTLTSLSGDSVAVEATRVAAMTPAPAAVVPAGVSNGVLMLFTDGTSIGIDDSGSTAIDQLVAGGAGTAELLANLDGDNVVIFTANVGSLTPVPADRLPTGIAAGTTISWGGNPGAALVADGVVVSAALVVHVQGTVAATVTALGADGSPAASGEWFARVTGATGASVRERNLVTARTGAGVYTVEVDEGVLTTGSIINATSHTAAVPNITCTPVIGPPSVITVAATTNADVATDADFSIRIIP